MEVKNLLEERGSRYGKFSKHAEITQSIKKDMSKFTLALVMLRKTFSFIHHTTHIKNTNISWNYFIILPQIQTTG